MRPWYLFTALLLAGPLLAQDGTDDGHRPLVLVEALALPHSMAQVVQAVQQAWPYSFGQEPGARIVHEDRAAGLLEGVARFNYKSPTTSNRLATLGVIEYKISIRAENGLCRIRVSQFRHTGNRNAPGGPISLGPIYAAMRPTERIPGMSRSSAQRLNDDMRDQVKAHLAEVIKAFNRQLRSATLAE